MRPHVQRSYTISGKYGIYVCPTIAATDARCRILAGMLPGALPEVAARIRHDLDLLLSWRLELMQERGSTT